MDPVYKHQGSQEQSLADIHWMSHCNPCFFSASSVMNTLCWALAWGMKAYVGPVLRNIRNRRTKVRFRDNYRGIQLNSAHWMVGISSSIPRSASRILEARHLSHCKEMLRGFFTGETKQSRGKDFGYWYSVCVCVVGGGSLNETAGSDKLLYSEVPRAHRTVSQNLVLILDYE